MKYLHIYSAQINDILIIQSTVSINIFCKISKYIEWKYRKINLDLEILKTHIAKAASRKIPECQEDTVKNRK